MGRIDNGGRDDGADGGGVGLDREGAGNKGGKVGPGLGDDNRTSDAGKGEAEVRVL